MANRTRPKSKIFVSLSYSLVIFTCSLLRKEMFDMVLVGSLSTLSYSTWPFKLYRLSLKKPIAIFECPLSKCPSASSSLGPNLLLRIVVIIPLGRSVKCFFEVRFLSASPQLVLQPCRLVQWPDSQQKCKEHVKAISSFYSQITSK